MYGWSKICSALMIAITDATSIVGLTSGSVTWRNCFQPVTPSMDEASKTSFGIAETPPMNSGNVKPKFCHTYTNSTTTFAPKPVPVSQPTVPDPEQIGEELVDQAELLVEQVGHDQRHRRRGRMSGKNSEERKKVRNQSGILDCTRMARPRATRELKITAAMTKVIVLKNDTRTVGFAAELDEVVDADELGWGDDVPPEERQDDRSDDRNEREISRVRSGSARTPR